MSTQSMGSYFRYAIGETLLVVVGILLALQINNWNEERIEHEMIREYALNLSAAISADINMLKPVDMQILASIRQAEELAKYLRDRTVDEMNNSDFFFLTTTSGYRPYGWNRAALEQLKSSGGLRQMRNELLVQRISDYDALTYHLDQDYLEDHESARAIQEQVNKLIDLNYDTEKLGEVLVWVDGFTSADIDRRLTQYRATDTYAMLKDLRRPLLSNDLAVWPI